MRNENPHWVSNYKSMAPERLRNEISWVSTYVHFTKKEREARLAFLAREIALRDMVLG